MSGTTGCAPSAQIQRAGDEHVDITLFVPRDVATDLAWQLDKTVIKTVRGGYRRAYKALHGCIIEFQDFAAQVEKRWPSTASGPWNEKSSR
jgi:hypothetical protein